MLRTEKPFQFNAFIQQMCLVRRDINLATWLGGGRLGGGGKSRV